MPAAAPAATSMVPAELQALVAPHIDSYNYFIGEGLQEVVQRLDPIEVITHALPLAVRTARTTYAPPPARRSTLRGGCSRDWESN